MAEVRPGAFIAALILAPLVPAVAAGILFGLLFWLDSADNVFAMLAFAVIYATFLGAPTYLTFGTVAFLRAIPRGTPLWIAAAAANFLSAPVVLVIYRIVGPDWRDAFLATVFHILFGCIFSALWGTVFGFLYETFRGARREVER